MTKTKIGDIIEIPTKMGLRYAQFTHKNQRYGDLIVVFDSTYNARPNNLQEISSAPVRFFVFFPFSIAVKRGIFSVIGSHEVALENKKFPLFRAGIEDQKTKKVAVWWFWDGEKEWKVGELTSEHRKLPIREIWNDTLLIERIEEGWAPSLVV